MEYEVNDEITFDNGKVYTVIDTVLYDNNIYVYLGNMDENNDHDFIILKDHREGNSNYLVNLDSKEEFINVAKLFSADIPNIMSDTE